MYELFMLIRLTRRNAANAAARGRSPAWARAYTIILWFFFEGMGLILGAAIFLDGQAVYQSGKLPYVILVALAAATLGGFLSTLISKRS